MTMHIRLTWFLLFLTSSSQASISNATIQADATEISRLNQAFISSSPASFHQIQSLVCTIINNCCPDIKTRLNEYTSKSTMGGPIVLLNECIGNQPRQSFLKTCPMVNKFLLVIQNKEFINYTIVIVTAASKIEISDIQIERPCSSDEAYAMLCDWKQRKQLESCERKALTYVSQHNSNDEYKTYVREVKANLHFLTNTIKSAFPMKKNKKQNCLQQFKSQKNQRYPQTNECN
jgi:hypothetical protein